MSSLYATVCSVDGHGVLVPFGDPHVFVLDNDLWRFDGAAIRYPTLFVGPVGGGGAWRVVMAMGYAPYAQQVGVVDLGTHRLGGGQLAVRPSIDFTFENKTVTIQRPLQELQAPRKTLPRLVRMLTRA